MPKNTRAKCRPSPLCKPAHESSQPQGATYGQYRYQSGNALLEWLIVSLPLLWLGSLVVEVSHWHNTRQQLALAAQKATVFASLTGGQSESVSRYLNAQLAHGIRGELKICVTDQVKQLMHDFKDDRLSQQLGRDVIRHDHITAQHRGFLAKGWPNGQGPQSRKSISAANQLNVSVTLKHRPVSPLIRYVIPWVGISTHHHAIMQSHRVDNPQTCAHLETDTR